MSGTAYIYALSDPSKPIIPRYIGRTKRDPRVKPYEHVAWSLRENCKHKNSELREWLRSFSKTQTLPRLLIYEIVTPDQAEIRERYWTEFFKPIGLLNIKSGDKLDRTRHGQLYSIWRNSEKGKRHFERRKAQPKVKQLGLNFREHGNVGYKVAIICQETGESFASVLEASKALGVTHGAIRSCMKNGWKCKGRYWEVNSYQK